MLDRRILVVLFSNILCITLVQLLNHSVSGLAWTFLPYGVLVMFPAMNLKPAHSMICLLVTGLWLDAGMPVQFGFFTLAFPAAGALLHRMRHRFHRARMGHAVLIAHAVNLVLVLAMGIVQGGMWILEPIYGLRLGVDLVLSHLLLLVLAPWFWSWQVACLQLVGVHIFADKIDAT